MGFHFETPSAQKNGHHAACGLRHFSPPMAFTDRTVQGALVALGALGALEPAASSRCLQVKDVYQTRIIWHMMASATVRTLIKMEWNMMEQVRQLEKH